MEGLRGSERLDLYVLRGQGGRDRRNGVAAAGENATLRCVDGGNGDIRIAGQQFGHRGVGQPARFPVGAMRAAAIMRRPVIFMIGMYLGGNRYTISFESLADFSQLQSRQREAAVQAAIERYAALLEQHVRADPYNWFNFFDFWRGGDE